MGCLVTGAAGFIGSHLCEQLINDGQSVTGLDAFIPYYARTLKESNLYDLRRSRHFDFVECDLRTGDIASVLDGIDTVFHVAAMPGLVRSWSDFILYSSCNLDATHRLLEAARSRAVRHFIYISTSSVYGKMAVGSEEAALRPYSPYGVTKLGAEYLCQAYAQNFGLPTTILRLFSVYGPRQRPDMAYNIFIQALLHDQTLTVYGDGEQTRSNTFVADCINGIVAAWKHPERSIGETFNIGGGQVVALNKVISILAEQIGVQPRINYMETRVGDQRETSADISKARMMLGYAPLTDIAAGLQRQIAWQRSNVSDTVYQRAH